LSEERPDVTRSAGTLSCEEAGALLFLCAYDELKGDERAAVEAHVAVCKTCADELRKERALSQVLAALPQPAERLDPAGALLSQCRSELAEMLDDLEARQASAARSAWRRLWRRMALHPAWTAAALLLMGTGLGVASREWVRSNPVGSGGGTVNVRSMRPLSDQDLANMEVAGVSFVPSGGGNEPGAVQLRLLAEHPLVVSGSADDSDVRRVLTYVVKNGRRFDPDVRLDCLDALRRHASDAEVRQALEASARKDENPAVRLKALEALQDAADDPGVREVFVESLQEDPNPGVRIEAVNSLVHSMANRPLEALGRPLCPEDQHVLRTLEGLSRKDPNNYVRLQSAAALRELAPRELH
jgi:hypothetical protein